MGKSRKHLAKVDPQIETLLQARVSAVNLISHSLTFNSFSLAKLVLKELDRPRTELRKYHQSVKVILKKWIKEGFCRELFAEGEQSNKMICQFTEEAIKEFRAKSSMPLL